MAAEKINTIPKIIATTCVDTYTAIKAPATAPRVVATSRNIPIRIFVIPSFMYAAAAPDELAIEATNAAPMAYLISTPNPRVSNGIITTPPPSPVSEPKSPASTAPAKSTRVKDITSISFYCLFRFTKSFFR